MQAQLKIMLSMFANYNSCRGQEDFKFQNGESSLFLVNSREK